MQENSDLLHIISNETKESVDQLNIVTPSIYSSIFTKFAQNYHINMDNELDLSKDILQLECKNLTYMQDSTVKNAISLSAITTKAIDAIKEKNSTVLDLVLKETKALRKEIDKLKESVYKDDLTNVYNKKWLYDNLLKEDSELFKEDGTLIIIDIDYFKTVNNTYGHVVGDKVLISVANQLQKTQNHVIRYGGDKFLVIFSKDISKTQALRNLTDIRENILHNKLKVQDASFRISFSIGAKEFKADDSLVYTIKNAAESMNEDKVKIKQKINKIKEASKNQLTKQNTFFLETGISQIQTAKILVEKIEQPMKQIIYNIKRYNMPVSMILFYTNEDVSVKLRNHMRLTDVVETIKVGDAYFSFVFLLFTNNDGSYEFIKKIENSKLLDIKNYYYYEEIKSEIYNVYNFINSYLFQIAKKETFL